MKPTKTLGLALLATAFLISACKKDDDDAPAPTPVPTCKLSQTFYFDSTGTRYETATYTYTGNNLTKAAFNDGSYYTYEYSGDKVTRRSYYSPGETNPDYYQQLTYNSDGTINKAEVFITTPTGTENYDRMEFVYNAGKMDKINYYRYTSGTAEKALDITYTYTGNNIISVVLSTTDTPPDSLTYTYSYDSNPNYIKKQNAQIYLLDPFFGDIDPRLLPFALSENNVTGLAVDGSSPAPLTYTLDDKQNLKDIKVGNQNIVEYSYLCQ